MTNEVQVQFKSLSENVSFARSVVSIFFSQLDPTVDEIYDIKSAVSEAVTNSIVHGYNERKDNMITLKCSYQDRTAYIEIIDNGVGIANIEEAMTPLFTTAVDEERAGLGFSVMQSVTDTVNVSSEVGVGTIVKLTKKFV